MAKQKKESPAPKDFTMKPQNMIVLSFQQMFLFWGPILGVILIALSGIATFAVVGLGNMFSKPDEAGTRVGLMVGGIAAALLAVVVLIPLSRIIKDPQQM